MAVLGISTNTRLLGMAIISSNRLVEYSVRLHKSAWSPSKAQSIITSLEPCVRKFCIKKVVLSIPPSYHQTAAFESLRTGLCKYFEAKGISICMEPIKTAYGLCTPGQRQTKKALMQRVTQQFSELEYCYFKELRNKSKYYIKVFEAVAVAMLHSLS